jgi:hypothetical protein
MFQFFVRVILGVVLYVAFFLCLPPVLHLMGFSIGEDMLTLLHVVLALGVLAYAIWGRPVPVPW